MSQRLPEHIEPDRMAETGRRLTGTIAIGKMKRLLPLLFREEGNSADIGSADVDLSFGIDETGQKNITGTVVTDVRLQCQRCMQAIDLHIAENVSLAVVHSSQQASGLASYYEPLLVQEETVSLPELVEDEILLALPAVPLHESDQCQFSLAEVEEFSQTGTGDKKASSQNRDNTGSEKKNPFAVLEQLRKKD